MDVFLNFCHKDTGKRFTAHLNNALKQSGLSTSFFFQQQQDGDDSTKIGEIILPRDTQRAIENSQVFICIFSRNYASCVSCLEELSFVVRLEGRTILSVFYHVEPSHVGWQAGVFKAAFEDHEIRYDGERVERWRNSLKEVGKFSGWDLGDGNEADLISEVVKNVQAKLNYAPMHVADHIIGLDSRVDDVMRLLDVNADDVRMIGIHGMGGLGKTTLAKAVYNKIYTNFEGSCFLSDIRDASRSDLGLVKLQKQLLLDLFHEEDSNVNDVDRGIIIIRSRIRSKKVLLVLDDVNHERQLEKLAGKRDWYRDGSKVIITTRDEHVLNVHKVDKHHIYKLKELDPSQSLQLFSRHAFEMDQPIEGYMKLSENVVSTTGGLPLALEVLGSHFSVMTTLEEWEDTVRHLKNIPDDDVVEKLKISYDGLIKEEQQIFLDIACFFIGIDKDYATDIWKGCGLPNSIRKLLQKSLIKIDDENRLLMHDQLRDMGRRIVQLENLDDPGRRSRLWCHDVVFNVLKNCKGTRKVRGLILNEIPLEERQWETEAFKPMTNLKLLSVNHTFLEGCFKVLPSEIIWLQWQGCPLGYLPDDFNHEKLVVLDLSHSPSMRVLQDPSQNKTISSQQVVQKLKVLHLNGCSNLIRTPNFSRYASLEKLNLEGCVMLAEVHDSIHVLGKLINLNLKYCFLLKELPSSISGLHSLEKLLLSYCLRLSKLPEQLGSLKSLSELILDGTTIEQLPKSIGSLKRLRKLSLLSCMSLKVLPISIGELESLQELWLDGTAVSELPNTIGSLKKLKILSASCQSLNALPNTIGGLESLSDLLLESTSLTELPSSIGKLSNLKRLWVTGCQSLGRIPESVGGLNILAELRLDRTNMIGLPDSVVDLSGLEELDIRGGVFFKRLPDSIGNLSNLSTLLLDNTIITVLPTSIGFLVNLKKLSMSKCRELSKLPASMGNLKSLQHLNVEETPIVELPDDVGLLSNLVVLEMAHCRHLRELPVSFGSLKCLRTLKIQYNCELTRLPSSFSSLCSLEELDADHCNLQGVIPDDFENFSSLTTLNLSYNIFQNLPKSMSGLSQLKKLSLSHCTQLLEIPELPTSLAFLDAVNCTNMEKLPDLSCLSKLRELYLTNCERLIDIQGLNGLTSLEDLYLNGCGSYVSNSPGLGKETFIQLRHFGVSGSKVPSWFMFQTLSCVIPRVSDEGLKVRGVILCLVLSVDSEMPIDDGLDIPHVQFKVMNNGMQRMSPTLKLGNPKANQDQVYLYHFQEDDALVLNLEDGDEVKIINNCPPLTPSIHIKKVAIHLVYKPEDTKDSIQEKLAEFFNSMDAHEDALEIVQFHSLQAHNLQTYHPERRMRSGILLLVVILCCFYFWMM
ncbi:TMV resistance protein N-like [Amborella trichopoda]|uniref:TIR domain-containing protein n=1 Tax=Amborella trichopoda TaxID=13333 RepID=W1P569_AMBTC|nr:TMV resistance protein N-like [Amborella trichopoda]ERN02711.1 hypothetical protein AMTR_s00085p00128840 [Amborella trichopoda]|eukprot:XP_011622109.2 TMV resistance protein N-like [Amborella trichopoda]